MKKTAKMLPLVIAASTVLIFSVMLASCGQNAAESGKTETEQSGESEIETALPKGAKLVGTLGEEEIYAEEVGKEIIPQRFFDNDRKQYLAEAEVITYRLLNSMGEEIIPHPAEDFYFSEPGDMGNSNKYLMNCVYDGDFYQYEYKDGKYILTDEARHGTTGKLLNGFEETVYYWKAKYPYMMGRGLNYPDGSVFLPPIYFKVEAPFKDRFLVYYGIVRQAVETNAVDIMDIDGNILSSIYNSVFYYELSDGSYIGTAFCTGNFSDVFCRDENGQFYEEGAWFIDKDGNKLSEKFHVIEAQSALLGLHKITDPETEIEITTADGKKVVVRLKDYAIKE